MTGATDRDEEEAMAAVEPEEELSGVEGVEAVGAIAKMKWA